MLNQTQPHDEGDAVLAKPTLPPAVAPTPSIPQPTHRNGTATPADCTTNNTAAAPITRVAAATEVATYWTQLAHEILTGIVSLVLLTVCMYLTIRTFNTADSVPLHAQKSESKIADVEPFSHDSKQSDTGTHNDFDKPSNSMKSNAVSKDATRTTGTVPAIRADADPYLRQKDLVLLLMPLLSAVMGYYLGRVPAEKQTQQMQQFAQGNQQLAVAAQSTAHKAESALVAFKSEMCDELETTRQLLKGGVSAESSRLDSQNNSTAIVLRKLDELSRKARHG